VITTFLSLAVPTSVSAGAATAVSNMDRKTLSIESIGTATYQPQISLDTTSPPASSSWQNEGAAISTNTAVEIDKPAAWVRLNCTAYTNGTPVGRIAGNR
jgi:hypothetical protein